MRVASRRSPVASAAAAIVLLAGASTVRAQDVGIPLGAPASNVTIETLAGQPAPLSEHWGQRPVLLEFWATWCPNCEKLEPAIRRITAKYGDRLDVVGVTVSFNQRPERVKTYAERHGLTHRILFDRRGDAAEAYRVPATSFVAIVGSDGRVAYTGLGGDQKLEEAVERVLAAERARAAARADSTPSATRLPEPRRP